MIKKINKNSNEKSSFNNLIFGVRKNITKPKIIKKDDIANKFNIIKYFYIRIDLRL